MGRLLCLLAVFAALVSCAASAAPDGNAVRTPSAEATYAYGSHPRQELTAHWRPGAAPTGIPTDPTRGRLPGIVVLHGGFWVQDQHPGWESWARELTGRGFVTFTVEYRRNIDAGWPGQRRDVLRALHWIKEHSASFGLDPRRIVLLGSSAGGHLAVSAGSYGEGRKRVAGVVGLSAVADPLRAWREGAAKGAGESVRRVRDNARLLAGCTPRTGYPRSRCSRLWQDMRALTHASGRGDPPMLLLHSQGDFVPVTHARDLARAQRQRGAPAGHVRAEAKAGNAHGGPLLRLPGVTREVLDWSMARGRSRE